MTTVIYQGDQYYVPVKIKMGEETLTPNNVDGVKIAFGGAVQEHPGELTFDGTEFWLFHLSQNLSMSLTGKAPMQVEITKGNTIQHSAIKTVDVSGSLFGGTANGK